MYCDALACNKGWCGQQMWEWPNILRPKLLILDETLTTCYIIYIIVPKWLPRYFLCFCKYFNTQLLSSNGSVGYRF